MTNGDFEVEWAPSALRALERLPEKVAAACIEFVYGSLVENPSRVGNALRSNLKGKHSARRGDYRVVFNIDNRRRVTTIIALFHRSDSYRLH